jgi:hypothetical protein
MGENENIPSNDFPVTFNPYKHHMGFLKHKIKNWKGQKWPVVEQELRCIGNNLIDLYYGKFTVKMILEEISVFAEKNKLSDPESLEKWLSPHEYRKTELSDSSIWIIRQGLDSSRYLHIHPAKHSPCTFRVRATTLKTVAAFMVLNENPAEADFSLKTINMIRTEKLGLSPVKSLEKGKGISRVREYFNLA